MRLLENEKNSKGQDKIVQELLSSFSPLAATSLSGSTLCIDFHRITKDASIVIPHQILTVLVKEREIQGQVMLLFLLSSFQGTVGICIEGLVQFQLVHSSP